MEEARRSRHASRAYPLSVEVLKGREMNPTNLSRPQMLAVSF